MGKWIVIGIFTLGRLALLSGAASALVLRGEFQRVWNNALGRGLSLDGIQALGEKVIPSSPIESRRKQVKRGGYNVGRASMRALQGDGRGLL